MPRRLKRLAVLSIWDEMWSLGEGCGVPDEINFIDTLTSAGIEIDYLIPEPPGGGTPCVRDGLKYHTYPNVFSRTGLLPSHARRLLMPGRYYKAVLPALRKLVAERDPDLLLGYSSYTFQALEKVAKETGLPAVAKLFGVMYLNHRDLPPHRYWWYNYEQILALKHRLDHYIVLNDGTQGRDALVSRGIPAEDISWLPNGMDISWADLEVDVDSARKSFGLPTGKTLLMTFSRLVRSKRVDLFLEAAAAIDPALAGDMAIVIGGDGPDRTALEDSAADLGLSDKTFFTGAIKYDEIPRLLKCTDIFVGTNELTNMSMPPCEALLCGIPVVAFDVAGTSEAVIDGRTGLLAPNGDLAALTASMERLLRDPSLRITLGREAKEFAREYFMSWEQRIARELEVFDSLLPE